MTEVLRPFQYVEPNTVAEAVKALKDDPTAALCAGGTDLVVRLRKGLSDTGTVIRLDRIKDLSTLEHTENGMRLGAGVSLAEIARNKVIAENYPAIAQAANCVAGPSHREVATLGGNLCLDTRCVYYNQSHWWRKSNNFCLKYRGETCHVAPQGNRCRAAFSGELAPALMVHEAELEIAGPAGTRRIALSDFYEEDGAAHLRLDHSEIVVAAFLPRNSAVSAYRKIAVRGAIDFPLAGVAVACNKADGATKFTIAITGTNSKPLLIDFNHELTPDTDVDSYFVGMEKQVQKSVSPQRTTTIAPHYRRLSAAALSVRLAKSLL